MFETTDKQAIDVKELAHDKYLPILDKILPELVKAIENIPHEARPPVYIASYQYGTHIIDANGIYLPLVKGGNISFNDTKLPAKLAKGLGYDPHFSSPVGIILNKNCEYFAESEDRIVPYTILHHGESIGLSWALKNAIRPTNESHSEPAFLWDLTAGARSIFMLSKVADKPQHIKLQKRYALTADVPKTSHEQWQVFKDIAHKANSPWRAEILFFDNKWFELLKNPQYGPYLYMQLSAVHEKTNRIWHHMPSWDKTYGQIELKQSLSSYPTDVLYTGKHLFAIIAKCAPGFRPAINDNSAPVKLIQDAYTNGYQLEHCATLMEACMFGEDEFPIYYSTNYPTLPQYSHPKRRIIDTLYKVKSVMEFFQTNIQTAHGVRARSLLNVAAKVDFSYYHDNPGDYTNIKNATLVAQEDTRFINEKNCNFPYHSAFLTGLVKISLKKL